MNIIFFILILTQHVACGNGADTLKTKLNGCSFKVFNCDNGEIQKKYGYLSEVERLGLRDSTKEMFYFAFSNYMEHAYPLDELDPINCKGRGPDHANPSNININDVLGGYSLTLIDSLGTLAVIGDADQFKKSVQLVIENVTFDKDNTIQVFEANIRIIGSLLSAHLLIIDSSQPFGQLEPDWYEGELLEMASDLASRLLPAFENSKTGLPHPRVNLKTGVPRNARTDTCTAGAGSLLVEFGILSRLLGDPIYELSARRAVEALWKLRNNKTGLFGNVVDVNTGAWEGELSGVGAGLDSFYEYMLKAYILFGNTDDYVMFNKTYSLIKQYMRRGRPNCNSGHGEHPLYVNVHMQSGLTKTSWIDSLQAAFAGIQVLAGDVEEAICAHALYYAIWKKYGVLPERFNWQYIVPEIAFYPLRPEFVESTYLLYQATKNPFYLHVGKEIVYSLNNLSRVTCGYATIHSVVDKSLEDRMESFFLSETCKYLYLLFDIDNPINRDSWRYMFTTEGHVIPLGAWLRTSADNSLFSSQVSSELLFNTSSTNCQAVNEDRTFGLPLESRYLAQVSSLMGIEF